MSSPRPRMPLSVAFSRTPEQARRDAESVPGDHEHDYEMIGKGLKRCVTCRQVDEIGKCQWQPIKAEPACGLPGAAEVLAGRRGSVVPQPIPLCVQHKANHDQTYAALRTLNAALRGGR